MTQKTIDDLFSDSGPFNEAEVIEVLHPIITIQKSTNLVFFKDNKISATKKILAYALAKKLLKAKSINKSETISAQEVYEKTGLKKGTIDPTFKRLREEGFFVGKKEYEIPSHKVVDAINLIKK
jgi:Fic family protein